MNTKILLLVLITIILFACNKTNSSNPQLTFVSVNSTSLHTGDQLIFNLSFTDEQGEVDTLFIKRVSKVCSDTANTGWGLDSTEYPTPIPSYPSTKRQKGTLSINFGYSKDPNKINTCYLLSDETRGTSKTDTSYFKFCLKDAAGHLSDTVSSPAITFLLN